MLKPTFSILITTKNRLEDLKITLNKISGLLAREDVECIICDDGSTDGTYGFVASNYKKIKLLQNKKSGGLIFSRNLLLNLTTAEYAITLDDDAHILSENPLETIEHFFKKNSKCGVIGFRIFWGKENPKTTTHNLSKARVKGFVGCGHAWRMEAWKAISDYPAWFIFYGEEEFASYQLFKNQWQIWFVPDILVHHRVNIKARKKDKDYITRQRRSLRSGWYLYFIFLPKKLIPKKFIYSLWMQLKLKVFKGDIKILGAIIMAFLDVVVNSPKFSNYKRLTLEEYKAFQALENTKIYWKPDN